MESELLHWLEGRLPSHPKVLLGPGDDAAILQLAGNGRCIVTSDTLNQGVDFPADACDFRLIGRKSLAVNLSDLAAMAARPVAAIVALSLPRRGALEIAQGLFEGMIPLARQFDVAVAGGDTNTWDAPLAIGITAIGEPAGSDCLTRRGARPGDAIIVTGQFGGSILGKHYGFTPRVREALQLNADYQLHAGIDVSDGLARDLGHLTRQSRCGAVIDPAAVPIAADAHRLAQRDPTGVTALEHALSDGEDFELILAVPPEEADRLLRRQPLDVPLSRIGRFVEKPGLWTLAADGTHQPLEPRGYEH